MDADLEADNLCTMKDLTDETLLAVLRDRYSDGQIYTSAGLMLLSLNPYMPLDLHGPAVYSLYRRRRTDDLKPHIYALLEECRADRAAYGTHSIVVSGESGSGKTETVRHMMDYLGIPLMEAVDAIIESMGNSRTVNNGNSSRFGRLVRLDGTVSIETFLLERSRVTNSLSEHNFHIFYTVLAHHSLRISNDFIDNVECGGGFRSNDTTQQTPEHFTYEQLSGAFESLGIPFSAIESVILGIVHLGSLRIAADGIVKDEAFYRTLSCLGLEEEELENYLLYKKLVIGNEVIMKENTTQTAYTLRDSIARLLYDGLFSHVIQQINAFLSRQPIQETGLCILDIFGFEDLPFNGLDQFCINWCNEKIYDEFVQGTFRHQKELLKEEGMGVATDRLLDSLVMQDSILSTIENRHGIADIISEESFLGGTAESLGIKLSKILSQQVLPLNILRLTHFAGPIDYSLEDFLAKNRETGLLTGLFTAGRSPLIDAILAASPHGSAVRSADIVKSFRENIRGLFCLLSGTRVKYVKCIKPNGTKSPLVFDDRLVSDQLKSNGILQAVELSKRLYPHSMFVDEFDRRYGILNGTDGTDGADGLIRGTRRCFFNNRTFNILEAGLLSVYETARFTIRHCCGRVASRLLAEREAREAQRAIEEQQAREARQAREEQRMREIEAEYERERMRSALTEQDTRCDSEEIVNRMPFLDNIAEEAASMTASADSESSYEDSADTDCLSAGCLRLDGRQNGHTGCSSQDDPDSRTSSSVAVEPVQTVEMAAVTDKAERADKGIAIDFTADSQGPHSRCAERIRALEEELRKYKSFSVSCSQCQTIQQKYRIQSQQLAVKQNVEIELERLRTRLRRYEDSEESSVESPSIYNIFGCLIQLFIDFCPAYSDRDIPRDEMLSLAHAVYFILGVLRESELEQNLTVFLDETHRRIAEFEESIHVIAFILSNLFEIKILIGTELEEICGEAISADVPGVRERRHRLENCIPLLDTALTGLFAHYCMLKHRILDPVIPSSVLEYQHLKERRVGESIYKRMFAVPSISKLIGHLEYFYSLDAYYCIPDVAILSGFSFLLSSVDTLCFNSLLAKKKFLSLNRSIQINYNLSEMERFCFGVGLKCAGTVYMKEAMRIATAIGSGMAESNYKRSGGKEDPTRGMDSTQGIDYYGLFDGSFLNASQINALINLFDGRSVSHPLGAEKSLKRFLGEPAAAVPGLDGLRSRLNFVKPKYLPDKSLRSILRILDD